MAQLGKQNWSFVKKRLIYKNRSFLSHEKPKKRLHLPRKIWNICYTVAKHDMDKRVLVDGTQIHRYLVGLIAVVCHSTTHANGRKQKNSFIFIKIR